MADSNLSPLTHTGYDMMNLGFDCRLTRVVNSDDGLIRGVEVKSGKVMKTLRGHESAVRTLWTGIIAGKEVLISGSFDKSVLIYR